VPEQRQRRSENTTITRSTKNKGRKGKTDWTRLNKLTDSDIRRAIRSDPDAAPELDAAWFRRAKIVIPEGKEALSIRLDRDVMKWFRRQGRGYQTRINAVLRAYVEAQR
jgi:uncharacterized protein (DUF4415 family)